MQHLNMPLQRPLADTRGSKNNSLQTLQTDSAFKNKFPHFDHQNQGIDAPKAFHQVPSNPESRTQIHDDRSELDFYKQHAHLLDDPSTHKLGITDSMLQGRVKANGQLETWAQSRSTNLLDSTDPSKMMVLGSREEAILKTSIDPYAK